jgi:HAD superfamily hydrolase (TIGR01549 family)
MFDLDGTLNNVRPTSVEAFITYCVDLGLTLDADARRNIVRWNHEHWAKDRALINYDEEHLTKDAFLEKHLRIFISGLGMTGIIEEKLIPQIVARFRDDFSPKSYLEPGAKNLLHSLREVGLRLGLVSNRDRLLDEAATELGIIQYFDFTLAAGQVNSWKPDTVIFHHALKMGGGVLPAEAVHIGDNYYADVVGARNAGMRAILIDGEGAFPEAKSECLVISHLSDLENLLPHRMKW